MKKDCQVDFPPEHAACNTQASTRVLLLCNSLEPDGFNFFHALLDGDDSVELVHFGTINRCKNLRQENGAFLTNDAGCQKRLDALFTEEGAGRFHTVVYSANRPFAANKVKLQKMLYQLKALNPQIQLITMAGYINTRRDCAFYVNKYHTSAVCSRKENVVYFGDNPSAKPLYQSIMSLSDFHIDMVGLLCRRGTLEFALMAGQMYREQNRGFRTEILGRPGGR